MKESIFKFEAKRCGNVKRAIKLVSDEQER